MARVGAICPLAFLAIASSCVAPGAPPPPDRQERQPHAFHQLIVRLHRDSVPEHALNPTQPAAVRRQVLARALREYHVHDRARGAVLAIVNSYPGATASSLWMIHALIVSVPAEAVGAIARVAGVTSVEADESLHQPVWMPRSMAPAPWNLAQVGAPSLWRRGAYGDGAVVAVVDSGVDWHHADLEDRFRGGPGDWYDPFGQHDHPYDATGHGTAVAGIIVGGDSGGSPIGLAPHARWIAARVFDDQGSSSLGAAHLALQWALDPDGDPLTDDAPDVVNASWGLQGHENECILEFEKDLRLLRSAGIAVVFAAGNTGSEPLSSLSPANNASAIAVGAIDLQLEVMSASNRGPNACSGGTYPHLVAPGAHVSTADLTAGGAFPDSYAVLSGTSFAAPHVTGAIALLRGLYPQASVNQLQISLTASAGDLAEAGPDNDTGYGIVDANAAASFLDALFAQCHDGDGDGFYDSDDCGGPADCDDQDPSVLSGVC